MTDNINNTILDFFTSNVIKILTDNKFKKIEIDIPDYIIKERKYLFTNKEIDVLKLQRLGEGIYSDIIINQIREELHQE